MLRFRNTGIDFQSSNETVNSTEGIEAKRIEQKQTESNSKATTSGDVTLERLNDEIEGGSPPASYYFGFMNDWNINLNSDSDNSRFSQESLPSLENPDFILFDDVTMFHVATMIQKVEWSLPLRVFVTKNFVLRLILRHIRLTDDPSDFLSSLPEETQRQVGPYFRTPHQGCFPWSRI